MSARKPFPLRIREDILDGISKWAADDLRSVNGQIEYLLRDALWRSGRLNRLDPPDPSQDIVTDD